MRLNAMNVIALVLVIVGALNWGLVGAFGFDLVAALFGEMSALSRLVYVLVGLAGLYLVFAAFVSRPHEHGARDVGYRSGHSPNVR